eukprot:TRINITY_DN21534_c0_g1_i1.p1 TRINITY_DN21534_c0_g1~~TRINITY_DN21534_c0_g1_i1.p1  ORF type:complete len:339 (+),score=155.98 TRINITY_DN21534_c0_g1_i1:46-1017(+)
MPGPRTAREEALLQRAKLLREEYRAIGTELGALSEDDSGFGAAERKEQIGAALQLLADFRAKLGGLPAELRGHQYFADLDDRAEQLEDRRRQLVRRQAQDENARVRRELLALQGIDALSDSATTAEAGAAAIRAECAAQVEQAEAAAAEQARLAEEAVQHRAAEEESKGRSRDHADQILTLRRLLDERDEEVRELRISLSRALARADEDRRRDRQDAVAEYINGREHAAKLSDAHAAGRKVEQELELEDRLRWRRRRNDAERQYAEVAAGRAQALKQRDEAFAAQERSLALREERLVALLQQLRQLPEVAAALRQLQGASVER